MPVEIHHIIRAMKQHYQAWAFHDFWCQIAIIALLHTLNYHTRALAEVMPMASPWEEPRWLLR